MKKRIWILILAVVLLAVLFVPIPRGEQINDGGTREYTAIAYKMVKWHRLVDIGEEPYYTKTRVYFGKDRFKTIDELWETERENIERSFIGTVLNLNTGTAHVQAVRGEDGRSGVTTFGLSVTDIDSDIKIGDTVKVTYKGDITDPNPSRNNAEIEKVSESFRNMAYRGAWLDRETAVKQDSGQSADLLIREIYSDCFFAVYKPDLKPYTVKVNGSISNDWCVGDTVRITYNEWYTDEENRMECELENIEASTAEVIPFEAFKPVIYLYPEKETDVSVNLALDGKLTCTYPAYENGWTVTASPDGTLRDESGQTYSYLYWEGESNTPWEMSRGFCVRGEDTSSFLEDALEKLGLNRREANEFIVYWLPLMQKNPYNIISFQTDVYTDFPRLDIEPKPDTLIRVFMAYEASDTAVEIEAQELTAPERTGFTAVEWGGGEVK